MKFEAYDTNGNYKTITHDILTDGTFTLNSDTFGSDYSIIQFTAPELAIDRVRVDFRLLLERTDPFIKVVRVETQDLTLTLRLMLSTQSLESQITHQSLFTDSTTDCVIGSGGDAGSIGDGGDGGGINIDGSRGSGKTPGVGGESPNPEHWS